MEAAEAPAGGTGTKALKVKGEPAAVDKNESVELVLEALQPKFNKLLPEPQPIVTCRLRHSDVAPR